MRKGMYILPSLFTTANIAAGYYAILQVTHGTVGEAWHFDNAAKAIGFAVLFDGLDGRIARMTGTSSDFGSELDSLADVITFGVAPALLAWMWGFHLLPPHHSPTFHTSWSNSARSRAFLFLMAGASRLARFNITSESAAVESRAAWQEIFRRHADSCGRRCDCRRRAFLRAVNRCLRWIGADLAAALVSAVGYLMVSTWRFYSFKDIDFRSRQPFRLIVLLVRLVCARSGSTRSWVLFRHRADLHVFRRLLALAVDLPAQADASRSPSLSGGSQTS